MANLEEVLEVNLDVLQGGYDTCADSGALDEEERAVLEQLLANVRTTHEELLERLNTAIKVRSSRQVGS